MRIEQETVKVVRIDKTLDLPKYESSLAAGMDLRASFHSELNGNSIPIKVKCKDGSSFELFGGYANDFTLNPGDRALVPTGIVIALPEGYECQVRPRSGLAWKHGITVLNSPGTIDADYRGCVCVLLINEGSEDFKVTHGERIAQAVVTKFTPIDWLEFDSVSELDETDRGGDGFGHTGNN